MYIRQRSASLVIATESRPRGADMGGFVTRQGLEDETSVGRRGTDLRDGPTCAKCQI
jgi:hypothetical protein